MNRRDLSRFRIMAGMILGFHFIFTAYGFWLPNDPRGSWSDTVREFDLLRFGNATKVNTTRSLAGDPHDCVRRVAAKEALRYPPVRFTGVQARAIAAGIAQAVDEGSYAICALAILPDHVHLVMRYHSRPVDAIASHMKAKATARMAAGSLHPLQEYASPDGRKPSPWARNCWCPFLCDERHVRAAIRYVQMNPIKAGFRAQQWWFVPRCE